MLPDEVRALLASAPPAPIQPKHLPATDPSLATEIMPAPPPPSFLFPPPNSHHRKPPTVLSYLPMLDPGSTYVNGISLSLSDGGTIMPAPDLDEARKKKRSRSQKPLNLPPKQQPTRTSARHSTPSNAQASSSKPTASTQDGDPAQAAPSTRASRQVSPVGVPPVTMASVDAVMARRSARKVKMAVSEPAVESPDAPMEPAQISALVSVPLDAQEALPISEDRATDVLNQSKPLSGVDGVSSVRYKGKNRSSDDDGTGREGSSDAHQSQYPDVCDACVTTIYAHPSMINLPVSASDREGGGALVYCDSCPKSFHLLCLNPPIDGQADKDEIPDGGWYCQECSVENEYLSTGRLPSPLPQSGTELFRPLLARLNAKNPKEFQLPEDIRHFYKNVVTGPRGGYIDGRKWRLAKGNKQLLSEDRDLFRTRDRNNRPVLCFKCGGSAVRSAISGDTQMAALVPSSPSVRSQEMSVPPEPQAMMALETPGLDALSAATIELLQDPMFPKVEAQEGDGAILDDFSSETVASTSTANASLTKVTGKRKREASPPVGMVLDTNSQNGPRTRRRTETGASWLKMTTFDPADGGRPILSCDFCPLHWHLDCVDPPMTGIPTSERRWMCPNHIEHIFAMKPRTPKHSDLPTVDINQPGYQNSGLVNIVSDDPPVPAPPPPQQRKRKPTVKTGRIEDMWVGPKRYRVPEHVVVLDFWRKVRDPNAPMLKRTRNGSSMDVDDRTDGGSSSSLTELSSSEGDGKKSGLSEKEMGRGGRGMPIGSRGGRPATRGRKRGRHIGATVPSRNMPRRGAVPRMSEAKMATNAAEVARLLTPPMDEPSDQALSPKLAATHNPQGGLTLRIPKLPRSPNGHAKPPSTSSVGRPFVLPNTPPLADPEDGGHLGEAFRKKRGSGMPTFPTRSGLRSSRGPNSDNATSGTEEPPAPTNGVLEAPKDVLLPSWPATGTASPFLKTTTPRDTPPKSLPSLLVYSNPGPYWQ